MTKYHQIIGELASLEGDSGMVDLLATGAARTLSIVFLSAAATLVHAAQPDEIPATIHASELLGRWGLASFQDLADRDRAEAAARAQCKNPYVITAGSSGGVIVADQVRPRELRLKGSPSGKTYIGPAGPTPGDQDREIISFDGRVLITRFVEKNAATRYGNWIYVRCETRT